MTYPSNIEEKIDFSLLREELHRRCTSPLGRERVAAMQWETDYTVVTHLLALVEQMQRVLSDASLSFPRGEICDVREAVSRIRVEGLFLDESELDSLRRTLTYAVDIERFLSSLDETRFAALKSLTPSPFNSLTPSPSHPLTPSSPHPFTLSSVVQAIDRVLDSYGKLADNASPELARIRREIVQQQGSVGRTLASILRQAKTDGFVETDISPTLREGRLVIPVPPAYKRKIGGIVHGESATGRTVFIEPQQVVEANNRIRELEGEERRERIRILQAVTDTIRPVLPQIMQSHELLGEIDFLLAKVSLADTLHAICPEVVDVPLLSWQEAYHPVLLLHYAPQGKHVEPMSVRLSREANRVLVISGPNAGGKSVCLKTAALLQYMVQCGLPVPVGEQSRAGLFGQLMIDIGDEQSIQDELSTYSSHLRNMKTFLREADERTLFLIDEMGSGTEPIIGGALAEAMLRELVNKGAFGLVTTHYTNLKHFAEETEGVVNGAMLYDRGAMRPLFQLSIGQAGSSFAIEIARQTGVSEGIIQYATELVGEAHIDYDRQLQDIARDKRYWERKRQQIRQKEKELEERIARLDEQLGSVKQQKKAILEEARQQAADILQKSNATIERTIREIKESKADKERTKAARQKVESEKRKVERLKDEGVKGLKDEGVKGVKDERKKVLKDFRDLRVLKGESLSPSPSHPLTPSSVHRTSSLRTSSHPLTLSPPSPSHPLIPSPVLSFSRTLDMRGMRADEAQEALIAYIDTAIMVNAGEVTILHGTGTGALKQLTRDYLKSLNRLRSKRGQEPIEYGDGDVNHGGAGLTIVQL